MLLAVRRHCLPVGHKTYVTTMHASLHFAVDYVNSGMHQAHELIVTVSWPWPVCKGFI